MMTRREQLKLLLLAASVPAVYAAARVLRGAGRGRSGRGGTPRRIQRYNILGRTGLEVSDIGFGTSATADPQLLVDAFHRGVNYFDISPTYPWSVEMLAAAFSRDPEMRRGAIVASRVECARYKDTMHCFGQMCGGPKLMPTACLGCIDEVLKKLGRSHIDILQRHGVGQGGEKEDMEWFDPNSPKGSGLLALFETLKRQGKVRFTGMTTHGPYSLDEAFERAVESGNFDTIMTALNFMQHPSPHFERSLQAARERRIGITAMKVLANAKARNVGPMSGRPFSHAAIAWALSRPGVNNVVISISDWGMLDEYLGASGCELSLVDRVQLARHRAATSSRYCRVGCGLCRSRCPHGVDIPTILRIDQYRSDYLLPDVAKEEYEAFPGRGRIQACLECEDPACEAACPFGVPVRSRVRRAYAYLDPKGTLFS